MSYSALYAIRVLKHKNEFQANSRELVTFQNAWGTGAVLFDHLCIKYLGEKEPGIWMTNPEIQMKLRGFLHNTDTPYYLRLAYAMSCNNTTFPVAKDKLDDLALALKQADLEIQTVSPDKICHWGAISEFLAKFTPKTGDVALALTCSSVADIWESYRKPEMQFRATTIDIFEMVARR